MEASRIAAAWHGARFAKAGLATLAALAGAVGVVVFLPGLPSAKVHRPTLNAARFRETLTGKVVTQRGATNQVVSMVGNATGSQPVLVRADLLADPARLESKSLQVEYLASGVICRGYVVHIKSYGFEGTCRMPNGERHAITAEWQLLEGNGLRGFVESRPLAA